MTEKANPPAQGDLLKALDDLTDLIAEQEQRGQVWSPEQEDDPAAFEDLAFDADDAADEFPEEMALAARPVMPSPAEIETLVDLVLSRHMDELRQQLAREIMIELRKRHPEL
jgi:hypothetical protein